MKTYEITWRGQIPSEFTERLNAAASRLLAQENAPDADNVRSAKEGTDASTIEPPTF